MSVWYRPSVNAGQDPIFRQAIHWSSAFLFYRNVNVIHWAIILNALCARRFSGLDVDEQLHPLRYVDSQSHDRVRASLLFGPSTYRVERLEFAADPCNLDTEISINFRLRVIAAKRH